MRLLLTSMAVACIVLPQTASSQDTRDAELAYSNDKLNTTYQALMHRLSPSDQTALRNAQRAWITFRDADCAFGFADHRDCLMQRTDEREKQLRDSVYFDTKGNFISLPEPK